MKSILPILSLYFVLFSALANAGDTPNIIFILADDQGYGDVSAYNEESKIPTPNIDRLAKEGMRFTDAHTSSSVCTPTRYSILTGRYHWRTRLQKGVLGGFSRPLIAKDRLTVAGLLQSKGYYTAAVGKWHLGMDWPLKSGEIADDGGDFSGGYKDGWKIDYKAAIQNGPVDLGFNTFFGISASLDMPPYVFIQDRIPTEEATVEKAFHRKGPAGASFEAIDVLPKLTKKTIAIIDQQAGKSKEGKPFFIYFPLNAPHTPILPAKEWQGKSGINIYADFTMQVDWTVGQVLQALDRNGITDDTLVIFTTDNGCSPAANIPELQAAGHEPSYIFRGHKADIFEGGHRVPFIVRWPGKVKAGTKSDQLIGQFDLMATAAEIVGAEVPVTAGEDSVSFLPALLGTDKGPIREGLVSQSINGSFAVRKGKWKLALCPGSGGWSHPRPREVNLNSMPAMQLYDLSKDPGEQNNLFGTEKEKEQELLALLKTSIKRGRSTAGKDQANDVEIQLIKPLPKPKSKKKGK